MNRFVILTRNQGLQRCLCLVVQIHSWQQASRDHTWRSRTACNKAVHSDVLTISYDFECQDMIPIVLQQQQQQRPPQTAKIYSPAFYISKSGTMK